MDDKLLLQLNFSDDLVNTITKTLCYNIGGKGGLESIASTRKEVMASSTSPPALENQIRPLTCHLHTTNRLSKDGHRHFVVTRKEWCSQETRFIPLTLTQQ